MSAWTDPAALTTGHLLTADDLNTYVRDNLSFLRTTPTAKAKRTTSQNIDFGTWTAVTLPSEDWDTDTIHSTSSNTSRLTVPTAMAGRWQFDCRLTWETNSSGDRGLAIRTNGSTQVYLSRELASTDTHYMFSSMTLNLNAGDYAEMMVWHSGPSTGAGGLDVDAAEFTATFAGGNPP